MIATMQGSQQVSKRKYDNHGYLLVATEGTEGTTYSYDDEGKLLSVAIHNNSRSEVYKYSYGDNGRLTSIANTTDASDRIDVVYEAQGGRTLTQRADNSRIPRDTIPGFVGTSQVMQILTDSPMSFFLLHGLSDSPDGSGKAVWNDHDQLTELQSYDAHGELVHRLILTYDSRGRVIEAKSVAENLKSQMLAQISDPRLPAEEKQKIQSIPLSCMDELSQSSASYTYDSEGHVKEERYMRGKRIVGHVERSYNEHGDLASVSTIDVDNNRAEDRPEPQTRYDYQYDSYGNWTRKTEKTVIVSSDGTQTSEHVTKHRKLSYW
jgi:hypothetical protein